MQKHTIRRGWRFVTGALASAALTALFSVTGLQGSAGRMASSEPVFGEELRSGLRGANDGVPRYADLGPVEHQ
jgi:hypothetical protein